MVNSIREKLNDKSLMRVIEAYVGTIYNSQTMNEYITGIKKEIQDNPLLEKDEIEFLQDVIKMYTVYY